jgi:hypothetical protein
VQLIAVRADHVEFQESNNRWIALYWGHIVLYHAKHTKIHTHTKLFVTQVLGERRGAGDTQLQNLVAACPTVTI